MKTYISWALGSLDRTWTQAAAASETDWHGSTAPQALSGAASSWPSLAASSRVAVAGSGACTPPATPLLARSTPAHKAGLPRHLQQTLVQSITKITCMCSLSQMYEYSVSGLTRQCIAYFVKINRFICYKKLFFPSSASNWLCRFWLVGSQL